MTKADIIIVHVLLDYLHDGFNCGGDRWFFNSSFVYNLTGENVYLRGFGTFLLKKRAEKTGRNITKNTTLKIPAHMIPAFKPAKEFVGEVKSMVKVK